MKRGLKIYLYSMISTTKAESQSLIRGRDGASLRFREDGISTSPLNIKKSATVISLENLNFLF